MLKCHRWTGAALGLLAVVHGAAALADWRPQPEPEEWRQLREAHLPESTWQFMEAIRNDRVHAAEYLRAAQAVGDTVEFSAALLLKKAGQTEWSTRVLAMRAVCADGRLERRSSDQSWSSYPSRPDTAVKVRWICSLP